MYNDGNMEFVIWDHITIAECISQYWKKQAVGNAEGDPGKQPHMTSFRSRGPVPGAYPVLHRNSYTSPTWKKKEISPGRKRKHLYFPDQHASQVLDL